MPFPISDGLSFFSSVSSLRGLIPSPFSVTTAFGGCTFPSITLGFHRAEAGSSRLPWPLFLSDTAEKRLSRFGLPDSEETHWLALSVIGAFFRLSYLAVSSFQRHSEEDGVLSGHDVTAVRPPQPAAFAKVPFDSPPTPTDRISTPIAHLLRTITTFSSLILMKRLVSVANPLRDPGPIRSKAWFCSSARRVYCQASPGLHWA